MHPSTDRYERSTEDLIKARKAQIEDAGALMKIKDRYIHVALTEEDGITSGLKFRDMRGSNTFLINLWASLLALFRHECLKLNYLPSGPEALGFTHFQSGGMWAEDLQGRHGGFPENSTDQMVCPKCLESNPSDKCRLRLDPEKIVVCPLCGWEPFQLRVQSNEDFEARGLDT